MTKRFQKEIEMYKPKPEVRFTLGVLACTVLSACILIVSSFTTIHISHYIIPFDAIFHPVLFSNVQHSASTFMADINYVPQVPAVAFMTVIIGRKYSFITLALYILLGLFLIPIFSLGGGIQYILQYGFGYLMGFFPMIYILSHFLKKDLKPKNMLLGSILSVTALHFVGIFYLILICAIRHDPFEYVQDLIYMMTIVKIAYDIVFTIICSYLANITRKLLWLAMD